MNHLNKPIAVKKSGSLKTLLFGILLLTYLSLTACAANVGVGLNVSVPIGNYGHISLGTGNWL